MNTRLHFWKLANATISRVFDKLLMYPQKLQFSCQLPFSSAPYLHRLLQQTLYFIYVIKEAKILYSDSQILDPTNKIKTTCRIVNLETHRKGSNAAVDSLNIYGRIINNQQLIANTYTNYFLSKTVNININNNNNNNNTYKTNIIPILTIIIVPYNLCHKFISLIHSFISIQP